MSTLTSHTAVTVRAPAKINLELSVGAPRADGFHELATVFHAVSLYDDVTASPLRPGAGPRSDVPGSDGAGSGGPGSDGAGPGGAGPDDPDDQVRITVQGVHADHVPLDGSNLAARAARLLARRTGITDRVHLHIRKGIPVAGGMAGGSADAAAALVACDQLWHTGLSRDELRVLAAELGSDVPFSLLGGTAIGTGRGERLTPALTRGDYHWVVALSTGRLSTPAVYAEIDRLRAGRVLPEPQVSQALMQALGRGDVEALGASLSNDLQPAAVSLQPALERTLTVGTEYGALGALVSGSGPTVVFLVEGVEQAMDVSIALTASGVAADVRRVHGPVPGARAVTAAAPDPS